MESRNSAPGTDTLTTLPPEWLLNTYYYNQNIKHKNTKSVIQLGKCESVTTVALIQRGYVLNQEFNVLNRQLMSYIR